MEEEFIRNQEQLRPQEEKHEVYFIWFALKKKKEQIPFRASFNHFF